MAYFPRIFGSRSVVKSTEACLAARPGAAYALYFTDGGSVDLDLEHATGPFDVHWIEVATGDWASRETIQGGKGTTINAPAKGGWIAAIVKPHRSGPSPLN